jgi:hypothetical protein
MKIENKILKTNGKKRVCGCRCKYKKIDILQKTILDFLERLKGLEEKCRRDRW